MRFMITRRVWTHLISLALVGLLLAGCGGGQAGQVAVETNAAPTADTPVPLTDTPTSVPPTNTPTPVPPTETPTAVPPTDTPTSVPRDPLVQRAVDAQNRIASHESFVSQETTVSLQVLDAETRGPTGQTLFSLAVPVGHTLNRTSYHIQGDSHNVNSEYEYKSVSTSSYTLTAETRLVDNVLYVNATREAEDESELDPMPEGWIEVKRAGTWPALDGLELGVYLEEPYDYQLFDDMDSLYLNPTEVSVESTTNEEGQAIDTILVVQRGRDIEAPLFNEGFVMDDTSVISAAITLNQNDEIVLFVLGSNIVQRKTEELDAGGKVIMEWKEIVLTTILISDVNKPLEPVKAPDL